MRKTQAVQKKWRTQRKAGKVQQVIDGGVVQVLVGVCERPGGANRARSTKRSTSMYVYTRNTSTVFIGPAGDERNRNRTVTVISYLLELV